MEPMSISCLVITDVLLLMLRKQLGTVTLMSRHFTELRKHACLLNKARSSKQRKLKVLKAQSAAKAKGYYDVLYLDCVHKKYLEEVSSCNIFVVKGDVISTPAIKGIILPGITRKSVIDVASKQGFQVEKRAVDVDELLEADEVFCTRTAVVVSPVGSITHQDKRVSYGESGFGAVSQKLYSVLTRLQMGLIEDKMDWTVELNPAKAY
ncbi:hypothetical protein ABKV19_012887 [Rosa sericea]